MYFKINNSKNNQYFFDIISDGNNKTLCHSETYHNKKDLEDTIKLIMKEANTATIEDATEKEKTRKSLWD